MITEGTTAVQAFEAGELDMDRRGCRPKSFRDSRTPPEYAQYPGLGTYYYGFNVEGDPDVKAASGDGARDRSPHDHRQHRAG